MRDVYTLNVPYHTSRWLGLLLGRKWHCFLHARTQSAFQLRHLIGWARSASGEYSLMILRKRTFHAITRFRVRYIRFSLHLFVASLTTDRQAGVFVAGVVATTRHLLEMLLYSSSE